MEAQEKKLSEQESLDLIATMISKAKEAYHETGIGVIMWGTIVTLCSLVRLSEIHFDFELPFDIYLLTVAAIIPQVIFTINQKRERRVKSYDEVYMDYLWLGFGICIVLMIIIVNHIFASLDPVIRHYREVSNAAMDSSDFRFSEFVYPLFLLLYGFPTFVTGAACKFKPMIWGGICCWLCCVIAIYTPIKIDLLLTAVSASMAWLIPGVLMEREYRIYKKEQARLNV